ncbi:pentapeptide repeat-containing protein [Streptosporangium canum]
MVRSRCHPRIGEITRHRSATERRVPALSGGAPAERGRGASSDGASSGGAFPDGVSPGGAFPGGAFPDGASLDGASLDGVSLDGVSLDGVSLEGAFRMASLRMASPLRARCLLGRGAPSDRGGWRGEGVPSPVRTAAGPAPPWNGCRAWRRCS